ncbi:TorF family putative porin [Falsiroseomonas sp.]|uniref:TorF family putative porin n=1 Tax=Falsiroseomonas sp. TaxID=2870721 RepID=UPI003F6E62D4
MIRSLKLATAALIGGMVLSSGAVQAQQTIESAGLTILTTPLIGSDYMFRGLSQTRNRPTAQVTVDVEHTSGLYVGAFVSNVAFAGTNARQEVDLSGGYRFELAGVKLDLGATYYAYPGYDAPTGGFELNYYEFLLRASYEIAPVKFVGLAAYSPDFTGESGTGIYLEGGFDMTLDYGFTIGGRVGYQWVERNFARPGRSEGAFGAEDYANYSVFVSREIIGGVIGTLSGVFTTLDQRADCFGGSKICDNRVTFTLSRPF